MTDEDRTHLQRAASRCANNEYCAADILDKLRSWGANEPEEIIKLLVEQRFIDHNRFASAYTRDKFRFNGWGKQKIAYMLRMKQIESTIIADALNEIDDDAYREQLQNLINKKKKTVKAANNYDLQVKLFRFASSRGFEPHIIQQIINTDPL